MGAEGVDNEERWQNRSGLVFAIDNHIVDGETAAEVELRRLHVDGWIELVLTDVTRTEWLDAAPEKRKVLDELGLGYAEYQGPLVLEHSVPGRSVRGSPEDEKRLRRVFSILFPNLVYDEAAAQEERRQDFRDAMNVATAIRYCVNGFVTRDGAGKSRGVLDSSDAIKDAFDDFRIMAPEQAVAIASRAVARWKGWNQQSD